MKTIIFFFLFVPTMSEAQNFMRFDDFAQGLTRGFQLQADCERGGFKCFNADLEKLDEQTVELVDVDDLTKPIYSSPTNITPCEDQQACGQLLPGLCGQGALPFFRFKEESKTYEAYCTTVIGYEQKKEPRLTEDNQKKQAKQLRRQEREARRTARQTVEARMARLARQSDLTAAESREVTLWLLRQELRSEE